MEQTVTHDGTDDTDGRLSTTELTLRYPDGESPAVDGVSLDIAPGQLTALVGPNGSGKSTLLKGLSAQLAPASGRAILDGQAVATYDDATLARRLGVLHQESDGPDALTVERLVGHGRYPYRGFLEGPSDADRAAVERALSLTGIERLRDRPLADLSGGQRRLAWLAMVLAQDTDVLLLDEPTTFLDLRHQLTVMQVVRELRDDADAAVVAVLHDIEQAARYADEMVVLSEGRVAARGPPAEVVTPELLERVFGIEATVDTDAQGVRIRPLRPLAGSPGGR
jgi:iron complex transport system ATP-binding protein